MNFFRNGIKALRRRAMNAADVSGAEIQENMDLVRMTMFVRALKDNLYRADRKKEEFDKLADKIAKMSKGELLFNIQDCLDEQMSTYLENLQTAIESERANETLKKNTNVGLSEAVEKRMLSSMGWSLSLRDSSIPNSGKGVFLNGRVKPGYLLTVIPGVTYLREHIVNPDLFAPLTKVKSHYKYCYFDATVVDASNYVPSSPLALGHMVNHPSDPTRPDLQPNVLLVPFDFSKKQFKRYPTLIPNQYIAPEKLMYQLANNHAFANSYVRSLAVVSILEIKNEELLLDYRLPPQAQPNWYKEVDESTKRKWNLYVEEDKYLHPAFYEDEDEDTFPD